MSLNCLAGVLTNPIKHLCSHVKMAVHQLSSNLTEDLQRNMSEYVEIQECKARSIIPLEMGAVTAAKDASTD